jgi:hypothetical protein
MQLKSLLLRLKTRIGNLTKSTWFLVIMSVVLINLSCVCGYQGSPVYRAIKVGETNGVIVDQAGKIHVLYSLSALADRGDSVYGIYYAYRSGGDDWQTETLDTRRGPEVHTFRRGPDGRLHAFYGSSRHTTYAWKELGGAWETETFLTNGYVGDVAFDAAGAMHLTHVRWLTNTILLDNVRPLYAYRPAAGRFHSREIEISGFSERDYGRVSDVAVDSTGKAHVVFDIHALLWRKIDYVQIAANDGDITPRETIASAWSTNWHPSLAIDGDDVLHLAFTGYHTTEPEEELNRPKLKYMASHDGGATWTEETLVDENDETGEAPELAIDDSGGLHIAYLSPETYEVRYAYKAPGAESWSIETVNSEVPTYVDISLTLDGTGSPFILYPKVAADTPETPRATDTPWAPDVTDTPWTPDRADFLDLKLAHRTGDGQWVIETIPRSLR